MTHEELIKMIVNMAPKSFTYSANNSYIITSDLYIGMIKKYKNKKYTWLGKRKKVIVLCFCSRLWTFVHLHGERTHCFSR